MDLEFELVTGNGNPFSTFTDSQKHVTKFDLLKRKSINDMT